MRNSNSRGLFIPRQLFSSTTSFFCVLIVPGQLLKLFLSISSFFCFLIGPL